MNPLNWTAVPFLELYVVVAGAALVILWGLRNRFAAGRASGLSDDSEAFDPLDLAYLAGGQKRLIDAAMVGLFEAGALTPSAERKKRAARALVALPAGLRDFYDAVPDDTIDRRDFHSRMTVRGRAVISSLAQRGLVMTEAELNWFRGLACLVLAAPVVLGVAKIFVGLSRDKPVGILTCLVIVTIVLGGLLVTGGPFHTRAGGRLLARARRQNARAARAPLDSELLLAFALSGAAVLAGRAYQRFFQSASDGSGSSSSCSGGSSCGGGGGCGCGGGGG